MTMKKVTRIAAAIAVGLMGTTAFGATMIANNSNKGSLLIAPFIDVRPGVDTLITMGNDSSFPVQVKCYYRTSNPFEGRGGTGGNGPFVGFTKNLIDFTFRLTPHQVVTWSAGTGFTIGGSTSEFGGSVASLLQVPGGIPVGELKCFAVGTDPATGVAVPVFHNHLFMDVAIIGNISGSAGQAWEYNAWAFQVLVGTAAGISGLQAQQPLPAPATPVENAFGELESTLNLDGIAYDRCPNILIGAFHPAGSVITPTTDSIAAAGATFVAVASCTQDLTERQRPFITKFLWTFWNQDERSFTGLWECGDSHYVRNLATIPQGFGRFQSFTGMQLTGGLRTASGYFTLESVGDTFICPGATRFGMVGVKWSSGALELNGEGGAEAQVLEGAYVRGTNLLGRGTAVGAISWNPTTGDSFKK
jgi:hypothetical protein